MNVVATAVEPTVTDELLTKPPPVSVIFVSGLPAVICDGVMLDRMGTGFVNGRMFSVPFTKVNE
jgi:hypothetical protein